MKIIDNIHDWTVESNRLERIWMMAKMEFKLRYYENKLGLLWALIKPISMIIVYFIAFEIILGTAVPNFPIYLFSGLMMWLFFVESTSGSIAILRTKRYLYEYTNMSKLEIYFSTMISNIIGLVFNLIVYFIAAAFTGIYPSFYALYFPIIALSLIILCMGLALILSNLFILFKDITQIWGIVVSAGIFLSPIFLSGDLFTKKIPIINYLNPISGIIINTREVVMYNTNPDWIMVAYDYAYAFIILAIGIYTLQKHSHKASEVL